MSTNIVANERITAKQVRLILEDKMIGLVSIRDALYRARNAGLDLVVISEGDIPVCRLLNVDRFRFERSKTEREQARRQRELMVETKELQLRPVTCEADLRVKAKRARSFLEEGDKVKIVVRFRGRERTHKDEGYKIIEHFLTEVGDHKVDKPLTEGESDLTVILASNVNKAEKKRVKIRESRAAVA